MNHLKVLNCLGINHQTADADRRDAVSLPADAAALFQQELAAQGVTQSMVLSTCNRCEIFFWGDADAAAVCCAVFERWFPCLAGDSGLRLRVGQEALVYLFRIAAGLESLIFGEYQILGQVKAAHAAALSAGHLGKELDRILRDAVTAAKRVKTELDIGGVPMSVCRAGLDLVNRRGGIADKAVFIIGSGRTGSLAARTVKRHGARSLTVCNRNPERARRLELEVGATVVDYAARYEVIARSDLVVSATASPHRVVCADRLRVTRPTLFLDLASPRDVDPDVTANPLVDLISIDTIGELAAGDQAERARLTARGMAIILPAVAALETWLLCGKFWYNYPNEIKSWKAKRYGTH